MSRGEERREGVRYITDLSVVLRDGRGAPLDERAIAHDVSVKGFKLETQCALEKDQTVSFSLDMPEGARATGRGLVIWAKREQFATWAGVKIVSMPWAEKRRLKRLIEPDTADWGRIGDLAFKAAFAVTVVAAAQRFVFAHKNGGEELARFAPRAAAVMLMGWALLGLLRPRR